jgi:Tol biopolymer transport system component
VTADGTTLLFSSTRVDGNCTTTNQGKDIYTALLQPPTGEPTAPAVPMPDVNGPGNDVDPSFSADFCELYFASDRDGSYALYRAHRR